MYRLKSRTGLQRLENRIFNIAIIKNFCQIQKRSATKNSIIIKRK